MTTVSFAGDLGDTLYLLASLPKLGGPFDLVLYPAPGMVREPFFPEKVQRLKTFFELQPCIKQVRYSDQPEGRNLDGWRKGKWGRNRILADMMAQHLGLPDPDRHTPWLRVDRPNRVAPVVVHRSPRYRDRSRFPWRKIVEHYGATNMIVVGSPDEFDQLNHDCGGGLQYHRTDDLLALARVIAGAELFIGNQSAPFALALGLGVNQIWLQQHRDRKNNCCWQRPGVVFDRQKHYPALPVWSSKDCEAQPPAGFEVEYQGMRVANLDKLGTQAAAASSTR